MNYRVLLPVTGSPDLVRQKVHEDIHDPSRLTIVNNFDNDEVATLCLEAQAMGATYFYIPTNHGLAASWNLGLKEMENNEEIDFVILMSASAKFNLPLQHFLDNIELQEEILPHHKYQASPQVTLHCFAVTRIGLKMMGYWDENFYPIYGEDTDMCYRTKLLQDAGHEIRTMIFSNPPDSVVSASFSNAVNTDKRLLIQYQQNAGRMGDYFQRKWGVPMGIWDGPEAWKFPFNNSTWGINEWVREGQTFTALESKPPRPVLPQVTKSAPPLPPTPG